MDQVKVGKFIETCRKKSKLTQEQLAEKLFVDRTLVSKWEHGKLCPDIKYYQMLCEIFQIELKELLSGEKNNRYNKLELNSNLINYFVKQSNVIKMFKRVIAVMIIIIFIFLLYYFYETYNKTTIFTFYGSLEHFSINQGLLVLTREKSYLSLNNNEFKSYNITIYYYQNNDKHIIYDGPSTNIIIDFTGYNSSINISNYKKIIDNIFMEISSNDTKEVIHLNFNKNYSNHKLFFKDDKDIIDSETESKTDNIYDCKESICSYNDENFQILYDTVIKKVTITDNSDVYIDYFLNTKSFNYSDSKVNFDVVDGHVNCGKSNCNNDEKIYKKFYDKYLKHFEKN